MVTDTKNGIDEPSSNSSLVCSLLHKDAKRGVGKLFGDQVKGQMYVRFKNHDQQYDRYLFHYIWQMYVVRKYR